MMTKRQVQKLTQPNTERRNFFTDSGGGNFPSTYTRAENVVWVEKKATQSFATTKRFKKTEVLSL